MLLKTSLWMVVCLFPICGFAQTKVFTWMNGNCFHSSTFDPKVHSREQITGAETLLTKNYLLTDEYLFGDKTVDPAQYLPGLQAKASAYQREVSSLRLPATPLWETYRARKLKEIQMDFRVLSFKYQAFSRPEILDTFGFHDSCLDVHAKALSQGGKALLDDWKSLITIQARRNGSPARVWKEYQEKSASPHRIAYAKFDLLHFAWGNCANRHVPRLNTLLQHEVELAEFMKLFLKTKSSCEESQG